MSERSLTSVAARGGVTTLLAQLVRMVVMLLQVMILARLIEPASFGLLAMVISMTGIAVILRDFGLSTSALRSPNLTSQQRSNLFWMNTGIGLLLAVIIFALSWPIATFYGQQELVILVQWLAPTYLLSGMSAQFRVAINQTFRFKALAACDVVPPVLALALAIPVALAGHGLSALIVLQLTAPVADLILTVSLARWWPGLARKTAGMRELLSFGFGFAGTQLLSYLSRNVDSIMLGRVWGATTLGYYDRAFQLAGTPINQINAPMTKVAVPTLSKIADNPERFNRGIHSAQLVACYATATILFVGAGLAKPLIGVFLGPDWATVAPLFAIIAIASVFRAIQQIAVWILVTQGNSRSLLFSYLIGQPIIIVCILSGLPWGAVGVATGSLVGHAIFWIISIIWAGKVTGIAVWPLLKRALRVILFVGAPAGFVAFVLSELIALPSFGSLLLGGAGALFVLMLSWMLSKQTRIEVATLQKFLRTGLRRAE